MYFENALQHFDVYIYIFFGTDNLNVLINIPPVPRPETGALTSTNNDQAFEKLFTANIMAAFR